MGKTQDMSRSESVSTKQQRIAELAKQAPDMAMNVSHHMDLEWMREAYRRTRKGGAVGVDGQTAAEYAKALDSNLQGLLDRAKGGTYRAPPVRRVFIPKEGGRRGERPIGIPTFEDKVLQRAVVMALEPIYEQDFVDCSYGFRPRRSAHDALRALRDGLTGMIEAGGAYVIELDIRSYFDSVSHVHIQEVIRRRVQDGVLRRLIGKWLNAGVMEEQQVRYPEEGVPQGGVISPILSNIFLHEVLDGWFEKEVKGRMEGRAFMVRFADDAVLVFERKRDADRVMRVLALRFEKFGLTLHPDKTRMVNFRRPPLPWEERKDGGQDKNDRGGGSFDFLGFTHYWGRTRRGGWAVKRKTAKQRQARAAQRIGGWLKRVRHWPIAKQHEELNKKLRGHLQYYGIPGNHQRVTDFIHEVQKRWRKWLARRSWKTRRSWEWFNGLLKRFPVLPARLMAPRC